MAAFRALPFAPHLSDSGFDMDFFANHIATTHSLLQVTA
jgi:hypothetical protein